MYLLPAVNLALAAVLFAGTRTVARDAQKLQDWMAATTAEDGASERELQRAALSGEYQVAEPCPCHLRHGISTGSLPAIVDKARHTAGSTVVEMNRTLPSQASRFTPEG